MTYILENSYFIINKKKVPILYLYRFLRIVLIPGRTDS